MSLLSYVSRPKRWGDTSWIRPAILGMSFLRKRLTGRAPLLDDPGRIAALPPYIPPEPTEAFLSELEGLVRKIVADPTRILHKLAREGPERDVLEIGCGTGTMAVGLALAGKRVWCGDLAPHTSIVKLLAERMGVGDRVRAVRFGAQVPFRDESFDLVFMRASLEHVPDLDACVEEVARVLRPGGRFLFAVPCFPWYEVQAWLRGDPDLIFDYAHEHTSERSWPGWRRALGKRFTGKLYGKSLPVLGDMERRLPLPPFPSWADTFFAPFATRLVGDYRKT